MKAKPLKLIILILTAGMLLFSVLAYADVAQLTKSNLYQVNVIIFEHITPKALNSELWPEITTPPDISKAVLPRLLSKKSIAIENN